VSWPGNDIAILAILAFVVAYSLALVTLLRRRHAQSLAPDKTAAAGVAAP
jgi:hypothetical protein